MSGKPGSRLWLIISIVLCVTGIVFLCLSIFTQPKDSAYLSIALGCIVLANLMNIMRNRRGRKA